jgi:hypothetical protein
MTPLLLLLAAPPAPNFARDVMPVLTRTGCNSGACHGALAGKGGFRLSLRGYDPDADHFTITRELLGRRVDPADPDNSLLLAKAVKAVPHGGGTRFEADSDHARVLRAWIAAGAPGPTAADPVVTGLSVEPTAARLAPGDTVQLRVTATYSDGLKRDVTALAKFATSDEQTAAVNEDGLVTVGGRGEAGVSALFGVKVATATVTSPFAGSAGPAPRRRNVIDDHVAAKLAALGLPASPDCTDEAFVRRVFLDVCGILPTPAEVDAFLADRSPDRRAGLIDRLLARPEYVDLWAHKWSDLLLVSGRKLPTPAVWAFYRAVRQAVADNRGWDRFARDLLTATGSTVADGGGNFFVVHKDPPARAEAAAVTFLGLSIGCAKCHNHPLERWTQDQYWGFANLFGRVGLKAGGPGETLVTPLPAGDALHPRTGRPPPPAPLDGPALAVDDPGDRRRHLADWLTRPDNPFFAKAVVNRVWKHLMGRGLVEADDDLRDTNPPTNAPLLDALVGDFVGHGFDVKRLVRLVVSSAAYQRSSAPLPGNAADDRFYSRYLVRRLPAEVILDAYSDVTGVPTPFGTVSLGPSGGVAKADYPPGTRAVQLPDSLLVSRFLDAFGRASREQACACERTSDSSVGQGLHLNNGQTLNDKLRSPTGVVAKWLKDGSTDAQIVERVFRHALGRRPTVTEAERFAAAVRAAGPAGRAEAVEDAVWAVLSGKEFLFNH